MNVESIAFGAIQKLEFNQILVLSGHILESTVDLAACRSQDLIADHSL